MVTILNENVVKKIERTVSFNEKQIRKIVNEPSKRAIQLPKGTIWTCDFGENLGREINGIKPCLVYQSDDNINSSTVIVMPLVRKCAPGNENFYHFKEEDIHRYFTSGEIDGGVVIDQIRAVSKGRIGKLIAEVSEEAMIEIGNQMRKTLGLF